MLAEIGYAKTTVRALAEQAGVAPGTLYILYNSKDELILAAVQDLLITLSEATREQSAEGLDRLITRLAVNSATVQDNPAYAEAMTRALFGTQKDDQLRSILYTGNVEYGAAQLKHAMELEHIKVGTDVHALAKHLQAQNWGMTIAWVMGMIELEELATETIRSSAMTLLAVTTPKGESFLRELVARHGLTRWPPC